MTWIADPGLGVCLEISLAFNCDNLCHIILYWFQFQVRAADLEFVLELFVFWFHTVWWYCSISWFQTGLFVPGFSCSLWSPVFCPKPVCHTANLTIQIHLSAPLTLTDKCYFSKSKVLHVQSS